MDIVKYLSCITIHSRVKALMFIVIWIIPFGLQYILIWLDQTGFKFNKYLYNHLELNKELQLNVLSEQGIYTY